MLRGFCWVRVCWWLLLGVWVFGCSLRVDFVGCFGLRFCGVLREFVLVTSAVVGWVVWWVCVFGYFGLACPGFWVGLGVVLVCFS